jgi:hypothetical protein
MEIGNLVQGTQHGIEFIGKINYIDKYNPNNINVHYVYTKTGIKDADWFLKEKLKIWNPIQNEKVWFWNKDTKDSPILSEYGGISKDGDDGSRYYKNNKGKTFEFCEPFLYDFPSIFKEKK